MNCFGLVLLLMSFYRVAGSSPIELHVVDGKSGKPLSNARILVGQSESKSKIDASDHFEVRTNERGVAVLSSGLRHWIRIWVEWHALCQPKSDQAIYDTALVRSQGIVGSNSCGSATARAIPNTLYVFVQDESLTEKMRH